MAELFTSLGDPLLTRMSSVFEGEGFANWEIKMKIVLFYKLEEGI